MTSIDLREPYEPTLGDFIHWQIRKAKHAGEYLTPHGLNRRIGQLKLVEIPVCYASATKQWLKTGSVARKKAIRACLEEL